VLIGLRDSAIQKHASITAQRAAFKVTISEYIIGLEAAVKQATLANKAMLQTELDNYKALLAKVSLATDNLQEDVEEALKQLVTELRAELDTASESAKVLINEKITLLEVQIQRASTNAAAAASEAALILADYLGEVQGDAQATVTAAFIERRLSVRSSNTPTSLDNLNTLLQQLHAASAHVGAQLDVLIADAVELVSTTGGELQAALEEGSSGLETLISGWFQNVNDAGKEALEAQLLTTRDMLTKVRGYLVDVKAIKENELAEVTEKLAESVGHLQEKLTTTAAAGEEWVKQTVGEFQGTLGVLKTTAGVMRAELETQLMDIAATVAEQLGEFKESVIVAAKNNTKNTLDEHIAKLEGRLTHLRAAGADRYDEGKAALATVSDALNVRLGEYQEKLKMVAEAERAKWQLRLDATTKNLEELKVAGQGMLGTVQEQLSNVAGTVAAFIGGLEEQLTVAVAEKKAELMAKAAAFQQHLVTLRSSMTEDVQGQLTSAYTQMDAHIATLTAQMKTASAEATAQVQSKIDELHARKELLMKAVTNRKQALHELLVSLKTRMESYVKDLQAEVAIAKGDAKATIESRTAELQALIIELQAAIDGKLLDDIVQKFSVQLAAFQQAAVEKSAYLDPAVFVETFSDWLDTLVSTVNDEGLAEVIGAAIASNVIFDVDVEINVDVTVSSLIEFGETSNASKLSDDLRAMDEALWKVVSVRADESNCGELLDLDCDPNGGDPMPTPAPTPGAAYRSEICLILSGATMTLLA